MILGTNKGLGYHAARPLLAARSGRTNHARNAIQDFPATGYCEQLHDAETQPQAPSS